MDPDTTVSVSNTPGQDEAKTQYWRHHVSAWQASKLTQRGYATKHGLAIARFVYWKNKFCPAKPVMKQDFVKVRVDATRHSVRFTHPSGVVIECAAGTDVAWLQSILGLTHAT